MGGGRRWGGRKEERSEVAMKWMIQGMNVTNHVRSAVTSVMNRAKKEATSDPKHDTNELPLSDIISTLHKSLVSCILCLLPSSSPE